MLASPFRTHDEKGFKREVPLSDKLFKSKHKKWVLSDTATSSNVLFGLIKDGKFRPAIKQGKNTYRIFDVKCKHSN